MSALTRGVAGNDLGNNTLTAQWYRSIGLRTPAEKSEAPTTFGLAEPSSFFSPHGGLVVLRSGRRRTTIDVGPLGFSAIAAHGHADALAVTVSWGGQDLISDPGTGSDYGHPEWRSAMRATRAHANVAVDGQDQSINAAGPFLWLRHARTRVREGGF